MNQTTQHPLLKAVLQGRFDFFRSNSVHSPLPEASFHDMNQTCIYAWGMDYVCGNGVMEQDGTRVPTEEEIDQAIQYFSSKHLPFMWWTSAKILETKGFQFGGNLTGIALDISQALPPSLQAAANLEIKIAQTEAEVKALTDLASDVFAMSMKTSQQWPLLNNAVRIQGEQIHFIAYLNGVPVGSATLCISPTSAGIWNLATASEHRKQGIGFALVHAALVEAKKRHYNEVMAILLPEGLAWSGAMKLGFTEVCKFPFYMYGL